jgi:hypothetical protein
MFDNENIREPKKLNKNEFGGIKGIKFPEKFDIFVKNDTDIINHPEKQNAAPIIEIIVEIDKVLISI